MTISAPSDDLPLLLTLEEDEWHEIHLDFASLEDGQNEKGWNCYFVDCEYEGQQFENEEIPFWAMKPFYRFYMALSKKEQKGEGRIRYRRIQNGKKNTAEFRS